MARYFLAEINIEGFRGINNSNDPLKIKFHCNAVNSLHAPNGIGKTSIFEAIHYAIFGIVPRLEDLQSAEEPDNYYINMFHPGTAATIGLTFTSDNGSAEVEIVVTLDSKGNRTVTSPTNYPCPDVFLEKLREDFTLVDYGKFSEFVNTSALDRGRSFASLVGLSNYSKLRQAIEGVANTRVLNSDFSIQSLDVEIKNLQRNSNEDTQEILGLYRDITGKEVASLDDPQQLIETVTGALSSISLLKPLFHAETIMSVDLGTAHDLIKIAEGGEQRLRYIDVNKAIIELDMLKPSINETVEKTEIATVILERDQALLQVGSSLLRNLYTMAQEVITSSDWINKNICPTCDSHVNVSLDSHFTQQLSKYAIVDDLNQKINTKIKNSNLINRLRQLEELPTMGIPFDKRRYMGALRTAENGSLTIHIFEEIVALIEQLEVKRQSELAILRIEKIQLEEILPPSLVALAKQIDSAKQFRARLEKYNQAEKKLLSKTSQFAIRVKWKNFIDKAAKIFSKAESLLAAKIIKQIENNYQAIFANIMQGGTNVKPQLERAEKSEQLELKLADFHGLANINARAVLSESYRNAVAAAIFLSAAVIHKGAPRFVILDDVTSSFDAGNQFNLMEVIRTQLQYPANLDGLQFIILSHDTMLEKYFDRLNNGAGWHHQKLQGLPPISRVMVSAMESDRLRNQAELHLNAGQTDVGAPLVRHYLEYKLSQIITKLQIVVPPDYAIKGDKRTLSSYIDAIINAVELYGDAKRLILTPQQVNDFQKFHAPSIIANFISHYETGVGTPFSPHALLGVLISIDSLGDCFKYTDGSAPNNKRWYKRLDLK